MGTTNIADAYLKEATHEQQPTTKELVDTFLRGKHNTVEVDYEALGKELTRLYMTLKQFVKTYKQPVAVHKKGDKLILRRISPEEMEEEGK